MDPGQSSGEGSGATGDGASGSSGGAEGPMLPDLPPLGENHEAVETAVRLLQMRIESTARRMADTRRITEELQARRDILQRENARLHEAIDQERARQREAEAALRARRAARGAAGGSRGFPGAASTTGQGADGASASFGTSGLPLGSPRRPQAATRSAGTSTSPPAQEDEPQGPLNIMDFLDGP